MAETIGRADIIILADGQFFEASVRRIVKDADLEKVGKELGTKVGKSVQTGMDKETDRGHKRWRDRLRAGLDKIAGDFDKAGTRAGRLFGKGSRNDALNLFGSIIGGSVKAGGSVFRLTKQITSLGDSLKKAGSEGGGLSGILSKIGGPLVQAVIGVAVIKLITSSLSILGAAVSLTTGLVLALAGSLAFALVGGIAAVGGALVPLAAGLGVAALAFGGLQKMAKKAPFKELKKDFVGLQKSVAQEIFGKQGEGLKVFSSLLKTVKPLIVDIAGAIGDLVKQFGKFTQTKGFSDTMERLRGILPDMVTKLGNIGGNLLLGLGNAFIVVEPMVTRFLDWLEKITGAFAKSNDKDFRQSPMLRFFAEAEESAAIIGPLIMDIVKAIGILFSAGKGTGDSIFASLAEKAKELVTWLSSKEGQDALKQWFADAGKLAEKLGTVVTRVIEFIDALDTDRSRAALFTILDGIALIIQGLTWLVRVTDNWKGKFASMLAAVIMFFAGIWTNLSAKWTEFVRVLTTGGQTIVTNIKGFFMAIPGFFAGIWSFVAQAASAAWAALLQRASEAKAGIVGAWGSVVAFFTGIGNSIASAWGNATGRLKQRMNEAKLAIVAAFQGIKSKIAAIPGQIAGVFSGLAGKVVAKAGNLASRFAAWVASLAGKAKSTATGVISAFSGLATRIISRAGSILGRFTSWVAGLPGKARSIVQQIANAFSGLANKAIAKAGSITAALGRWASGVYSRARGVANDIVRAFSGLAGRIVDAIGNIVPKIKMPHIPIPTVVAKVIKPKAAGGIVSSPELAMIGEAGPEAVVPLSRALSQVDPAVRALSAFAQGITPSNSSGAPSIGRQIDVGGITINTPTEDPRAVASEVVARMTFAAYI